MEQLRKRAGQFWFLAWEQPGLRRVRDVWIATRFWLPKPHWLLLFSFCYVVIAFFLDAMVSSPLEGQSWVVWAGGTFAAILIGYHLTGLLRGMWFLEPLAPGWKSVERVQEFRPEIASPLDAFRHTVSDDTKLTHDEWCMRRDSMREVLSEPVRQMQAGILGVWALHSTMIFLQAAAFVGLASLGDPNLFSGPMAIEGVMDAVYFTAVTMTTIGYGDVRAGSFMGEFAIVAMAALTVAILTTAIGLVLQTVNELEHAVAGDLDMASGLPAPE